MKQLSAIRSFDALPLIPELLTALATHGYKKPMPVQACGLMPLLKRESAIIRARTGTGKTALFGLPLLQAVQSGEIRRALVLAPTRELAHQLSEEIGKLSENCDKTTVSALIGGRAISRQMAKLAAANVIIMTPGRAVEALESKRLKAEEVGIVVVDEADHMLEVGSLDVCARILELVVRKQTQLIFCSATFSDEIRTLCSRFRRDMLNITISAKTGDNGVVTEWAVQTFPEKHTQLTIEIIKQQQVSSCIVFCNHRQRVEEVTAGLQAAGLLAAPLHGDLDQKQRNSFMQRFRDGEFTVLVATDLASRGIDIPGLELVINYDFPYEVTDYVHRYGRTGRAGNDGMVVNFFNGKAVRRIEDVETRTGRQMRRHTFAELMSGGGSHGPSADLGGKTPPLTIENSSRLFIRCGRQDGMTFGGLKSMLRKDCALNVKKEVSFIDIQDDRTIIGVYAKKAKAVFGVLEKLSIRGKKLQVEQDDGEKSSAKPGRKRGKSVARVGKSRVGKGKSSRPKSTARKRPTGKTSRETRR
jgi:ATP-independent RNA helicase DbpA